MSDSDLEYWQGSVKIKGLDALISFSMFVKSEYALADSTAVNICYIKYYLERIATTASQIESTIVWCT